MLYNEAVKITRFLVGDVLFRCFVICAPNNFIKNTNIFYELQKRGNCSPPKA
jgi:hypothetical protein